MKITDNANKAFWHKVGIQLTAHVFSFWWDWSHCPLIYKMSVVSKALFNFNNDFLRTTFQFHYMPINILPVTLTWEDLQQKSQFTKRMNLQSA